MQPIKAIGCVHEPINQKGLTMKLTLVSIWYRGTRHSFFIHCIDGKVSQDQLSELVKKAGVIPGTTYSIGA